MNSSHTALGQALGYSYQFDRAAYRLLEADSTVVSVSIEHLDDVSIAHENGLTIREQDKATIGRVSPIGDGSVALWKTLAIWAEAVANNPESLTYTEFHLVTNATIAQDSLAAQIANAKTNASAREAVTKLLASARSLPTTLRSYGSQIADLPEEQLVNLVQNTFVFDNVSPSQGADLSALQSLRFLGELQKRIVFDGATGFVRRMALKAAQERRPATIDRKAFDSEMRALLRRVAVAPLSVIFNIEDGEIDPNKYKAHGFFQQLDWVDTDVAFIRECVIHFVQARVARLRWTDTNEVSEASLGAYRADLKSRWKLEAQRQRQNTYPSPEDQGRELLTETLGHDSSLDGQAMPKAITCGTFHDLADFDDAREPEIGWHPDFESLVKRSRT